MGIDGDAGRETGRNLSIYGMSYGLGFSLGPLGIPLLQLGDNAPFIVLAVLVLLVLVLVLVKLPDLRAEKLDAEDRPVKRFRRSYALAWYALIPALLYGYMESGINSNFPVYGLRVGLSEQQIAFLLPFIGVGGLILQLPLGMLSDRFERKRILMIHKHPWRPGVYARAACGNVDGRDFGAASSLTA